MTKNYQAYSVSAVVGIVYLIVSVFFSGFDTWIGGALFGRGTWFPITYGVSLAASMATYVIFMSGFIGIGKATENKLLAASAWWSVIAGTIASLYMITTFFGDARNGLIIIVLSALAVIPSIPFGIGLRKERARFGSVANAAGVLNILVGICVLSIIGSLLGVVLVIPTAILEIIILFKAAKQLKTA